MALIIFHLQDGAGNPLGDVVAQSVGGPGPWAATSNPCGDMITDLQPAHYDITFSKAGYVTRVLPADLGDCGIVTVGLETAGGGPPSPIRPPIHPLPPGVLPPIPTRAQVCAMQTSLAGLTYHTAAYGDIPAWFYGGLDNDDRAAARAAHHQAGDTHVPLPVTEAYREPGTLWPAELANGYDFTQDMDSYRVLATELIADGFFIDATLGGDGLGNGPDYNDPVGRTYGNGWLMANLERMIRALQGDGTPGRPDLTPYILFRPGWDAVFYGWGGAQGKGQASQYGLRWRYVGDKPRPGQPSTNALDEQQERVRDFGLLFRQILPAGYLSIEHTPGNIPCGEGGGDYAPGGLMTTFDTVLSEFNTFHEDSVLADRGTDARPVPPATGPASRRRSESAEVSGARIAPRALLLCGV